MSSVQMLDWSAFGKPFIASKFDVWVYKLADTDAGWFVKPDSSDEIASILLEIAENGAIAVTKGAKGKDFIRRYNWETESQKLLKLYHEIGAQHG